jgi:hypothetical protein
MYTTSWSSIGLTLVVHYINFPMVPLLWMLSPFVALPLLLPQLEGKKKPLYQISENRQGFNGTQ